MASYLDRGIILNSHKLGEFDKILNIYSSEKGLIRAVAKGARKQASKFRGKVDQLNYCIFHIVKGKNLDIVSEIEEKESFKNLKKDLLTLSYALLIIEVTKSFAHENEPESDVTFNLLYSSLKELESKKNIELIAINFLKEFLYIHGFSPQFNSCVSCSNDTGFRQQNSDCRLSYSPILGGLLCKDCLQVDHIPISKEVVESLIADKGSDIQNSKVRARETLNFLRHHIHARSKHEVKSFDLVFSL